MHRFFPIAQRNFLKNSSKALLGVTHALHLRSSSILYKDRAERLYLYTSPMIQHSSFTQIKGHAFGTLQNGENSHSNSDFHAAVNKLFITIDSGLEHMREVNHGFVVSYTSDSMQVDLGAGKGCYTLNKKLNELQVISPISASVYVYRYDVTNDWWVNTDDGHLFIDLFVRELLRSCKGMPNF
jgi:frataxin-like iron-binding protein CyaY